MKVLVVIPARYQSTRLPGKPLEIIGGSPMVVRVYSQVKKSSYITDIYVATDDIRIKEAVEKLGGKAIMTDANHESGTDRIAEAVQKIGGDYDVVLNVQGDEPFINPQQVDQLAKLFEDADTQIATLVKKIKSVDELHDTNKPKVTFNSNNEALLFSRATIPHLRGKEKSDWLNHHSFFKHIGIYAYRPKVLQELTKLAPSNLEKAESLEQLRWLENGYKIKIGITGIESISVDTPEDLEKARQMCL